MRDSFIFHLYTNMKSIFIQQFLGSSFVSPALGGVGQGRLNINNKIPPKKSGEARKQAGKKEGGWGEGIFARLPKRSPAALLVQSRAQQKSFLFLLEEKEIARQIKKCEENFFAEQRAKRAAAGRSVKVRSPDFRQKKFGFRPTSTTNRNFRRFGKGLPRGFAARHSGFAQGAKP